MAGPDDHVGLPLVGNVWYRLDAKLLEDAKSRLAFGVNAIAGCGRHVWFDDVGEKLAVVKS